MEVLDNCHRSVIYGTIFVCTCCWGSWRHIFQTVTVCLWAHSSQLCICWGQLCARGACQVHASHESPAALPHSVCVAFQWRRLWSFSLSGTSSYQIRCVINLKHFTRVVFNAGKKKKKNKSDCEMLKIITQSQQPFWDGWNWIYLCYVKMFVYSWDYVLTLNVQSADCCIKIRTLTWTLLDWIPRQAKHFSSLIDLERCTHLISMWASSSEFNRLLWAGRWDSR